VGLISLTQLSSSQIFTKPASIDIFYYLVINVVFHGFLNEILKFGWFLKLMALTLRNENLFSHNIDVVCGLVKSCEISLEYYRISGQNERKKMRENNVTFSHLFLVYFLKY